jgi:hypothetical protein
MRHDVKETLEAKQTHRKAELLGRKSYHKKSSRHFMSFENALNGPRAEHSTLQEEV